MNDKPWVARRSIRVVDPINQPIGMLVIEGAEWAVGEHYSYAVPESDEPPKFTFDSTEQVTMWRVDLPCRKGYREEFWPDGARRTVIYEPVLEFNYGVHERLLRKVPGFVPHTR